MKTIGIIMAALSIIGATVYRSARRRQQKIESAFAGREPLSTQQLHGRYFERQGIPRHIVDGVMIILSEHLDTDLSRLNAEDDFSKNLSFFWAFDSMADVEIVCALEKKFGIEISDQEAENAHTLNDIMRLVARKTLGHIAQNESAPAD